MNKDKHIVWSNLNLGFNDWKADLIEEYPEKSESELIDLMYEINSDYLNDERVNLDIQLNQDVITSYSIHYTKLYEKSYQIENIMQSLKQ